jgi:hypothetical protein
VIRFGAWLAVLGALLLGAAGASPACAQTKTASAAARIPDSDRAMVLAKLLNSEANIIGTADSDEKVLAMVPELFGSREELAKLEAEYPGIAVETVRALLPILNRSAKARLPDLWQRQAALYKSSFTSAELERLITLYSSTTGQKMMALLYRKAKPTAMMADMKKSDDFSISSEAVLKDIKATVPDIVSEMNAEDRQNLFKAFGEPGLQAKMRAMAPQTQAITLAWMNESVSGEDAELEAAALAVMERRMKHENSK